MLAPGVLCQSPSMSFINQTKNKIKWDEGVAKKKSKQNEAVKKIKAHSFSLQLQTLHIFKTKYHNQTIHTQQIINCVRSHSTE